MTGSHLLLYVLSLPPHRRHRPEWSGPEWTKRSRRILRSSPPTIGAFLGLTREITSVQSGDTNKFEGISKMIEMIYKYGANFPPSAQSAK